MLLHFSHVEASELCGARALSEEADGGSLPQPLCQPGQVTVAVEVVGVETAGTNRDLLTFHTWGITSVLLYHTVPFSQNTAVNDTVHD